jgi:hypothetical protein
VVGSADGQHSQAAVHEEESKHGGDGGAVNRKSSLLVLESRTGRKSICGGNGRLAEDVADVLGEPIDRDGLDQGVRLRVVAVAADPGKGGTAEKKRSRG